MMAILGTSDSCVATHASDLAVALVALDASLTLQNDQGQREIKLNDFYRLPEETPHLENQLQPGEIITAVRIAPLPWARRSTYLKIRDRESYEFALTSAAVALDIDGTTIRQARIAVGGVGTKPWLLPSVQDALTGEQASEETFQSATKLATLGVRALSMNGFKVELLQRTLVRALLQAGGMV